MLTIHDHCFLCDLLTLFKLKRAYRCLWLARRKVRHSLELERSYAKTLKSFLQMPVDAEDHYCEANTYENWKSWVLAAGPVLTTMPSDCRQIDDYRGQLRQHLRDSSCDPCNDFFQRKSNLLQTLGKLVSQQ